MRLSILLLLSACCLTDILAQKPGKPVSKKRARLPKPWCCQMKHMKIVLRQVLHKCITMEEDRLQESEFHPICRKFRYKLKISTPKYSKPKKCVKSSPMTPVAAIEAVLSKGKNALPPTIIDQMCGMCPSSKDQSTPDPFGVGVGNRGMTRWNHNVQMPPGGPLPPGDMFGGVETTQPRMGVGPGLVILLKETPGPPGWSPNDQKARSLKSVGPPGPPGWSPNDQKARSLKSVGPGLIEKGWSLEEPKSPMLMSHRENKSEGGLFEPKVPALGPKEPFLPKHPPEWSPLTDLDVPLVAKSPGFDSSLKRSSKGSFNATAIEIRRARIN